MLIRSFVFHLLMALLLATISGKAYAEGPTAEEIVRAADAVRNPQQAFRVGLTLVEYRNGKAGDKVELTVHSKLDKGTQQFKNLVRYTSPARDVGKLVLLNGSSLWFFDPASKASVRISPQQRLLGQAADGDVLSVNLARDYTSKIVGEEPLQDADHAEHNVWHLDLTGSTSNAMYSRVEYWIEKESNRPIKAKFYSDSGRLLKIAYYRKFEERLGGVHAMEIIIIDAVDSHLATKISYAGLSAEDAPDAWFQRDSLPMFKEE